MASIQFIRLLSSSIGSLIESWRGRRDGDHSRENISGVIFDSDLNTLYIPYEDFKNRSAPVGWDNNNMNGVDIADQLRRNYKTQ